MALTVITLTKENLMEIMNDECVYVIKRSNWSDEKHRMHPIKDVSVGELFSDNVIVVRITG